MGWILMQPDDSDASAAELALFRSDGICNFDVTMNGARLRPIRLGSRGCTERERHYHSFVGEAGCGRWAISQNREFLWGAEFFWLCGCSAITGILEYDGPIHQIRRFLSSLPSPCAHGEGCRRPYSAPESVDPWFENYSLVKLTLILWKPHHSPVCLKSLFFHHSILVSGHK
jgi:hypothetical protein